MIISFPIGAYVFFNSNIGDVINFEYPVSIFDFFFGEIASEIPIEFEIGDVFIVFWSFFIVLFAISMIGPKNDFSKNLIPLVTKGKWPEEKNYLFSFITWFAILVLVSGIIDYVQQGFGITIETPPNENSLIQFFEVTIAPIIEDDAPGCLAPARQRRQQNTRQRRNDRHHHEQLNQRCPSMCWSFHGKNS